MIGTVRRAASLRGGPPEAARRAFLSPKGAPVRQTGPTQGKSPARDLSPAPETPCKFTKNNPFCTTIFGGLLFFSQKKCIVRIFP